MKNFASDTDFGYTAGMNKRIPYMTQAALAERAGLTRSAVTEAVRCRLLATVETTGEPAARLIAIKEAERWLRERRPAGRPRKAE